MSSNLIGTATPAPGAITPSPAPAAGAVPTIVIPEDADPNTVAVMFAQQYPMLADYIAWLNSVARYSPPTAINGSSVGFSPVTHVGPGTGTISMSGKGSGGLYMVIKITSSGGAGVGVFSLSRDGGTTYAVTGVSIPGGTYADGTSGITFVFTGTFTSGDTYAFKSAFSPQAQFLGTDASAGLFQVDHNGLPAGRISYWDEPWKVYISAGITTDPFPNYGHMRFFRTAASNYTYLTNQNSTDGLANLQIVAAAVTTSDRAFVYQDAGVCGGGLSTGMITIFEWEASMSAVGANNFTVQMGLNYNTAANVTQSNLAFRRVSGVGSTWDAISTVGGVATVITGTQVAAANVRNKFRIEVHSTGTPIATALGGARALFFCDDVYQGAGAVPNIGQPGLAPHFGMTAVAGASLTLEVSGWNARAKRVNAGVL